MVKHQYWFLKLGMMLGEASLNFLLKRWLAQTAEAVLVHESVAEDEEYLNSQNFYTNVSNLLGCLRTGY